MQLSDSLYNPILPQIVLNKVRKLSANQEITEVTISVISSELFTQFHPEISNMEDTEDLKKVKRQLTERVRRAIATWESIGYIKIETKISKLKTAYKTIIPLIL